MGLLDEYQPGYFDAPVMPDTGFTMGGGLLADPADTGFGQRAPFGGLLSGPAPAAAPARGGLFGGLFGGGGGGGGFGGGSGEPMDWRSLLMSAGAGLLKSNGKLEGLGEGIMGGMRLGAQTAGNRQLAAMRGLQMQKLQKDMANEERLDSSWQRSIEEAEKIRNFVASPVQPIVAPTGEQFAEVPPAGPQTPGFPSNMPILSAGGGAAMPTLGGSQAAAVQAPPKPSNPFVAALVSMPAEHFGFVRGSDRTKGEQIALNFLNKENAPPPSVEGYDEQGRSIKRIWDRRTGSYVQIGGAKATDREPKYVNVNGRVHLQNLDGTPGQDIGAVGDPNALVKIGDAYHVKSDLDAWIAANRAGGDQPLPQPVPDQQPAAAPAPIDPRRPPRPGENYAGSYDLTMSTSSPALSQATEMQESGGNNALVSKKGAFGVRQIMPETWAEIALELGIADTPQNRASAAVSRQIGDTYMNKMLQRYGGNLPMALAAYNAGPGSVDTWAGTIGDPRLGQISNAEWSRRIPFRETRDYIPDVLALMQGGSAPSQTAQTAGQGAPVQTMPAPERRGTQVAGGPRPLLTVPREGRGVSVKDGDTGRNVIVPESQSFGREPGGEDKTFEQVKDLRHEFFKVSAPFIARRDSLNNMIAANRKDPTGADDIALVFGFMKMLDPGSVVRENEQATAQNAGGVLENVRNIYNGLLTGQKLPEQVRIDFMKQARSQYDRAYQQHRENENIFRGLAKANKFDPEQVVPDLSSAAARERAKEDLAEQKAAEEAALVLAEQRAMLSARSEGAAAKNLPPATPSPALNPAATMVPMRQAPAEAPRGSAVQVPIQAMGADGVMPPPAVPQQVERPPMRLPPGPVTGAAPYPGTGPKMPTGFPSATGPNGEKIYFNGKTWIDGQGREVGQ